MIARVWSGRTKSGDAEVYHDYVRKTGVKDLNATPGNRGTYLFRRVDGETAEFIVMSLWDSMEQIEAFAGKETGRAVYYPEDRRYLLEMSRDVIHYEILERPAPSPVIA